MAALSLEEKAWCDQREKDLREYSALGAAGGAIVSSSVTFVGRFPRPYQIATILGSAVIGSISGYLYADNKALERINDLSATSELRKQFRKLQHAKQAGKE
ncbi:hypothetical protein SPRG_12199 [Saprolegnia parasitica CBS 223.65]|nr:hypothetical protein SPRG_12199 [Saprolegnia parasitica CBS 223.65]XP_012212393.1 hypothetical protein SPRG_17637 [Saprolegnia parasitica CBS 223.65]KDO16900.1 hypothetical protein SPRG_17637 [Saprolegnia parasitica CBS 223.65]KDO22772.1 hypothetical protein SPRG_12199 [Saprolegnia parasitica CBS 223.65]|eukprot:XP_012206556.1 hypothetical protein SPRG_12199 [Saprolegnia parasitica CBS 223.65]